MGVRPGVGEASHRSVCRQGLQRARRHRRAKRHRRVLGAFGRHARRNLAVANGPAETCVMSGCGCGKTTNTPSLNAGASPQRTNARSIGQACNCFRSESTSCPDRNAPPPAAPHAHEHNLRKGTRKDNHPRSRSQPQTPCDDPKAMASSLFVDYNCPPTNTHKVERPPAPCPSGAHAAATNACRRRPRGPNRRKVKQWAPVPITNSHSNNNPSSDVRWGPSEARSKPDPRASHSARRFHVWGGGVRRTPTPTRNHLGKKPK